MKIKRIYRRITRTLKWVFRTKAFNKVKALDKTKASNKIKEIRQALKERL